MKKFFVGLILASVVISVPCIIDAKTKKKTTQKKTSTENVAGLTPLERKIVGKHMLSLQWLSTQYYGTVIIKKEADGTFSCQGEQLARNCKDADPECIKNDDYVKLDGTIQIIDEKNLTFTGDIREKIFHINNGEEVLRQGTYDFKSTNNRKYWRMFPVTNPADNCSDYIDIYFKR